MKKKSKKLHPFKVNYYLLSILQIGIMENGGIGAGSSYNLKNEILDINAILNEYVDNFRSYDYIFQGYFNSDINNSLFSPMEIKEERKIPFEIWFIRLVYQYAPIEWDFDRHEIGSEFIPFTEINQ